MRTRQFWVDATERAAKTAAQAVLLFLGGVPLDIVNLDWAGVGFAALGGAALSYLTSIASSGIGESDTASVVAAPAKAGRHRAPAS